MATKYIVFVTGGVVSGLGKDSRRQRLGRAADREGIERPHSEIRSVYLMSYPALMNPTQHG